MTCMACDHGQLPPCGDVGRNGLVWLILEHQDRDDHFYPHAVRVRVIDHGDVKWEGWWRVPSLDDRAYVWAADYDARLVGAR